MSTQSPISRRSVLKRSGVVGAAGLAVAAGGGGIAAAVMSSPSATDASADTSAGTNGSGAIVIYMADPKSGQMDIYAGTGKTSHTNHAMASMVASMAPKR